MHQCRNTCATEGKCSCRVAATQDADRTMSCPECGGIMRAVKGAKDAICEGCGFKDACCF